MLAQTAPRTERHYLSGLEPKDALPLMTDATVRINGVSAGPTHIGGYYRFAFDIAPLVHLLEVDVAKASSNKDTAKAENKGDYWMFGDTGTGRTPERHRAG